MTGTLPTTSFVRRMSSAAQLAAETRTKLEAGRVSEPVHKWRLYRTLTEAKAPFGLRDGTLTVLQALSAFHAETTLTLDSEDPSIVVFPSNRELSIRANGVPESTLRRHLARLVAVGLIARRDAPNGKRFARRDREGEMTALGFGSCAFHCVERIASRPLQPRSVPTRRDSVCCGRRSRSCACDCAGAIAALGEAGAGGGIRGAAGASSDANPAGAKAGVAPEASAPATCPLLRNAITGHSTASTPSGCRRLSHRSTRSRQAGGTPQKFFRDPHTCSRRAAPTVVVARTKRRITDQQPNL
jgi:hypothetical protein